MSEWNIEVVAAFMRAANGKGYCDALTEDAPGSLCHDHGYGYRAVAWPLRAELSRADDTSACLAKRSRRGSSSRSRCAAVLAVFLLYTSIAGGGTPSVAPSGSAARQVGHARRYVVLPGYTGDSYEGGLRFKLRDRKGPSAVTVRLQRDPFSTSSGSGREVSVKGRAEERRLRREARLARDEVPVEVHGEEELKCATRRRPPGR